MKKRFTAFILTLVIAFSFSSVSAQYYTESKKGGETFEEILQYSVDIDEISNDFNTALELFEKQESAVKIFEILNKYTDEFPQNTEQQIASLKASINNSAENNAYSTKVYNCCVDSYDILNKIIKGMAETDKYKSELLIWSRMTEAELEEYIAEMPTENEYRLLKEINALTEEYHNSQKEMPDFESYDEYVEYLKNMTKKVGNIFVQMVQKRNEIAKEHGYDNYADYAYAEIYDKDYGDAERKEFYNNTQKYISPLIEKLGTADYLISTDYKETRTDSQILDDTRVYLEKINPELTKAFDYMTGHGLYDMKKSDKKQSGCYTAYLDHFNVPFIFINPDGYNVQSTLVHEYGHYTAEFFDPFYSESNALESENRESNLDIAEIQSQGLEVLFYDYYGKLYGNSGRSEKISSVYSMTASIVDAALFSEWQEAVYKDDKITVDKCNSLFKQLCVKYNVDNLYGCDQNGGYTWVLVNHNFEAPMYYISYGVSAMAALDIMNESQENRKAAIDRYMKLSALGDHKEFKSSLEACGFDDVFDENTFKKISKSVKDFAGIGYDDVNDNDWFYPNVILTCDYMEGLSGERFSPNSDATRETFVTALGKMEDDIHGIESSATPFADIDNKFVSWAAEKGIAAGVDDTEFGGELPLTREQVVCFIYRFAGSPSSDGFVKFSDAEKVSAWASKAVSWAEENEIIAGYEDGSFHPKDNVTRAEAATLISMLYINYYE